jgi:hypothetical protein
MACCNQRNMTGSRHRFRATPRFRAAHISQRKEAPWRSPSTRSRRRPRPKTKPRPTSDSCRCGCRSTAFHALKQRASDQDTTLRALVLETVVQHYDLDVAPGEKKERRPEARKLRAQMYKQYKRASSIPTLDPERFGQKPNSLTADEIDCTR